MNGPSWTGSHIVGNRSVAGLAPGASAWYFIDWTIACSRPTGNYSYWARAIRGTSTALSPWKGPQSFTVAAGESALVESLWPVSGATVGGNAALWARIRNTGCNVLPADAAVQYWVTGPFWSGSHYVGTTSVAGLTPGAVQWKLLNWSIVASRPAGDYSYWARVIRGASIGLSPWNGPQDFVVTGLGFLSTFNGTISPWQIHNGSWANASSLWLYTPGVLGQVSSASYPANFADFDYEASIWRIGSQTGNANRLEVRGVPNPLHPTTKHWSDAYLFQFTKSGMYSVWKNDGGAQTPIQNWTATSAIKTGSAWNKIRVRAVGSSLRFYINDVLVWVGSDSTFTAGRVGLGMYAGGGSGGNGFWADDARLTVLNASGTLSIERGQGNASAETSADSSLETLDPEQRARNDAANARGLVGSVDEAPEQKADRLELQREPTTEDVPQPPRP